MDKVVVACFFLKMNKFILLALVVLAVKADPKPNIVLIVTDDLVRGLKLQMSEFFENIPSRVHTMQVIVVEIRS